MSSGITADKVNIYDGYEAKINAKQDVLSESQIAVLDSGITASDKTMILDDNNRLNKVENTITDINNSIGDIDDFSSSLTGNISNGESSNATTITQAIANIDATIGQIHGVADKVGTSNGGQNLGHNTTVEEHLTALASSIGDRTDYSEQNYINNNETVAKSLDNLDIAIESVHNDFTSTQIANQARFNGMEHKINKLETKMEKGLAANNALAALVPLNNCYKTQISAAMGGYENNQAFAVGAFHYVNRKVLLNTGVAYGGNNSLSYNVGITFGF